VKCREAVGTHDPDEAHRWIAAGEEAQGLAGVARADPRFEIGDVDAWMVGDAVRLGDPPVDGREFAPILQRIARRHHPPEAVEAQPPQGDETDMPVPEMGRVERATVEADA
jgi:hypothetical protein